MGWGGTRAMGWAKNIGWGSFYFFIYSFLAELFRGMLLKWKGANKKSHQK